MFKNEVMVVQGSEIKVTNIKDEDYICLTDMVQGFEGGNALIDSWLRNKNTIAFLGVWEKINNPHFNSLEFEGIKNNAGINSFHLSIKKWTDLTNSIGLFAKSGRYGGTFAHKDIAFEFGSWLSPEFKLYLIKEFQRLKEQEINKEKIEWDLRRTLTKTNYGIHTDAIKENLIPNEISQQQAAYIYASEADLLNMVLFGETAKQWREANPKLKGNIRDYAAVEQLVVLSTLESQNALLIKQGKTQSERLIILNKLAISQMKSIMKSPAMLKLTKDNE